MMYNCVLPPCLKPTEAKKCLPETRIGANISKPFTHARHLAQSLNAFTHLIFPKTLGGNYYYYLILYVNRLICWQIK